MFSYCCCLVFSSSISQPKFYQEHRGRRIAPLSASQYVTSIKKQIRSKTQKGMRPFGQRLLGWYMERLSNRLQRALLKLLSGGPCVITTIALDIPIAVWDAWFGPLLASVDGVTEEKTKTVVRYSVTSLAQLSRVVDPVCLSVGDTDGNMHKVVCTTEMPTMLRYSTRLETATLKVWAHVTNAQGLPMFDY